MLSPPGRLASTRLVAPKPGPTSSTSSPRSIPFRPHGSSFSSAPRAQRSDEQYQLWTRFTATNRSALGAAPDGEAVDRVLQHLAPLAEREAHERADPVGRLGGERRQRNGHHTRVERQPLAELHCVVVAEWVGVRRE